jgi:hypothetical protein
MKKNTAEKLEKIVVKLVESHIRGYEISDNFYGVSCDIYSSEYGIYCHITFLFKEPFSQKESDFFHNLSGGVRSKIKRTLGDLFVTNNISSQQSTIDSYQKTKWWYEEKKENFE